MQLQLSLGRRENRPEADPRAEKLHTLLLAARRTGFYARRLKGVGAESRLAETALAALPPIPFSMFRDNPEHFTNPRYASSGADKISRLWKWLAVAVASEAIAGSPAELIDLAGKVEAGEVLPPRGACRILVYTTLGERLLDPALRERLWKVFELPVFEQLRGFEGELLASECEAHAGMHLASDSAIFEVLRGELAVTSLVAMRKPVLRLQTGLAGSLDSRACPCGHTGARFLPAPAVPARRKPPSVTREIHALDDRRFATAW
jgi:hypothetical protein